MTPEQVLGNIATLLRALMLPAGIVLSLLAAYFYAAGKSQDSPRLVSRAMGTGLGAIVLFGAPAMIALLQYLSAQALGSS